MTSALSEAEPRTVEAYARELVSKPTGSRVLALAADPEYRGPRSVNVDGVEVQVRGCVSSLAIRELIADLPADGYAIVLTDRGIDDLGDSLVARFRRQRVVPLDAWATVPGLFRGRNLDSGLRHALPWLPGELLARLPAGGYPASATELVTRDHVLGALAGAVLGLEPGEIGLGGLLERLSDLSVRAEWAAVLLEAREAIAGWVVERAGPAAGAVLSLAAADSTSHVHVLALGLMLDVLYGAGDPPAGVLEARRGWESGYRLPRVAPAAAGQIGQAVRARMRLLGDTDPAARQDGWRDTAEAFAIAAFPAGIALSLNHPDGYRARLTALSAALQSLPALAGSDGAAPAAAVALEAALVDLHAHDLAWTDHQAETYRADMSVRLSRWLAAERTTPPANLAGAMNRQMTVDAWVDRAVADVWSGSTHPEAAEAYRDLCGRVLAARREHDRQFAALLATAAARETLDPGLLPVERVLVETIEPLSRVAPVLLIVIDGMSTGVTVAVAEGINGLAWTEHVPGPNVSGPGRGAGARASVLAALPTLTRYSRTSLLCGALRDGTQADEKRAFAALTGGPVFHKDDLRAPAGAAVNPAVAAAVGSAARVVGVVLNTVDDTLAKHDPDGTHWSVAAIQHLEPLLEVARQNGRTVVLVSDHGHVVERGGRADLRELADARWRPVATGPAGEGEILLSGPRVLAPGRAIVAAWVEDLRYGRKAAGYHGGAAAAEVTVPLLVFAGRGVDLSPAGWVCADEQAPRWWVEPVVAAGGANTGADADRVAARSRRRRVAVPVEAGEVLFALPGGPEGRGPEVGSAGPTADPHAAAIESFLVSPAYQRMRAAAGRATLPDAAVRQVIRHLLAGGGRSPADQIARAVGVPVGRMPMAMATLRRLLNVEGYQVISMDADGRTVLLDVPLWRQQFGVGE